MSPFLGISPENSTNVCSLMGKEKKEDVTHRVCVFTFVLVFAAVVGGEEAEVEEVDFIGTIIVRLWAPVARSRGSTVCRGQDPEVHEVNISITVSIASTLNLHIVVGISVY